MLTFAGFLGALILGGFSLESEASACRSNTPTIKKEIEELESKGFECEAPQLSIDSAEVNTPEKAEIFRIYKTMLLYLVNSSVNRNVSQVGANFEYGYYANGPVFLDGFPAPVSLRVSRNRVDFSHKELTLCTHFDPQTHTTHTVEIEAGIQVKGVIGLTGVCRTENDVRKDSKLVSGTRPLGETQGATSASTSDRPK